MDIDEKYGVNLQVMLGWIRKAHKERRNNKKHCCVAIWKDEFCILTDDFFDVNPNTKCIKLYSTSIKKFGDMSFDTIGKLKETKQNV